MARYKQYNYDQLKLLPISFSRQILPGTFEYTLSHIIDHELNLSIFNARYANDDTGAPAYDPAILLKIVLYAYARGITSSRNNRGPNNRGQTTVYVNRTYRRSGTLWEGRFRSCLTQEETYLLACLPALYRMNLVRADWWRTLRNTAGRATARTRRAKPMRC